jgi:hypothetical protein
MALAVDSPIPEDVLEEIRKQAQLRDAKLIVLEEKS